MQALDHAACARAANCTSHRRARPRFEHTGHPRGIDPAACPDVIAAPNGPVAPGHESRAFRWNAGSLCRSAASFPPPRQWRSACLTRRPRSCATASPALSSTAPGCTPAPGLLGQIEFQRMRQRAIGQRGVLGLHRRAAASQHMAGAIRAARDMAGDDPPGRCLMAEDAGGNRVDHAVPGTTQHLARNIAVAQRCSIRSQAFSGSLMRHWRGLVNVSSGRLGGALRGRMDVALGCL